MIIPPLKKYLMHIPSFYLKRIIWLLLCGLFSIGSFTAVYLISINTNAKPNSFIRLIPPHIAVPKKIVDLTYNSFYIAGADRKAIYLGNSTAPNLLLKVGNFSDTTQLHFTCNIKDLKLSKTSRWNIDSPFVYLMDGVSAQILKGDEFSRSLSKDTCNMYFVSGRAINNSSYLLRVIKGDQKENVLVKQTSSVIIEKKGVLTKQVDGIICADGDLLYNNNEKIIIYIYRYRNQFIALDTNLNELYKGRTIDTNTKVKFKVGKLESNRVTILSPPTICNKRSSTSDKFLFVLSGLISNNEDISTFQGASVIDIYSIKDGHYLFSFYLPNYNGLRIRDFIVQDNMLFGLYDHYLYVYELNFRKRLKV